MRENLRTWMRSGKRRKERGRSVQMRESNAVDQQAKAVRYPAALLSNIERSSEGEIQIYSNS